MATHIHLCATGKSGLGHIRRLTNLSAEVKKHSALTQIHLLTNAPLAGLTEEEERLFASVTTLPRQLMGQHLKSSNTDAVIVDTAIIPELEKVDAYLGLLLRQTVDKKLSLFALANNRPWDMLYVPNPEREWQPSARLVPTKSIEYVGWIYRQHFQGDDIYNQTAHEPFILVSCAGGGKNTSNSVLPQINELIAQLKQRYKINFTVKQVIGPRSKNLVMPIADECIRACPTLHLQFPFADLVISTAGYNSTLELANTAVPVLFTPVKRSFDDQFARARRWAPSMGRYFMQHSKDILQDWIKTILTQRRQRPPVELGPSGANRCAQLILDQCG